jgi:hypothetical protein
LADRGPWTPKELAGLDQMEGWREEQPEPIAAAKDEDEVEASSEDEGEPTPEDEAAQPINRGMLLKFLSSVRS